MKIGIDARNYFNEKKSGVDLYVKQISENLPKLDKDNHYIIYVDSRANKEGIKKLAKYAKVIKIPAKKRYLKAVDLMAKIHAVDYVHYLSGAPKKTKVPYFVTVYDLTFEQHPEFYDKNDLIKQKETKDSIKTSSGVIAISESTKNDIVKYYKINPNKIRVTHLAYRNDMPVPSDVNEGEYLLFVGNLQPRKNLSSIIDSIYLLKGNDNVKLLVAGNIQDKNEYNKVLRKIKKYGIEDKIEFRGYVDDEELDTLYKNCKAVIYPSIYEGFGYNILEAFYYTKPLITSNTSSMPEIAKDAAIFVDPNSAKSIANAMQEIINNPKESVILAKRGHGYLSFYKIDKMIKDTIKAYEYFSKKS